LRWKTLTGIARRAALLQEDSTVPQERLGARTGSGPNATEMKI